MFSFGIGGGNIKAIRSIEDVRQIKGDFYILGGGNNILCGKPTKPIYKIEIKKLEIIGGGVVIGAGNNIFESAKELVKKGYSTLLSISGIPGTIGGGIVMNCGGSQGNISDYLVEVVCFDVTNGRIVTLKKEECKFGFRNSIFKYNKNFIILSALFTAVKESKLNKKLEMIQEYRKSNYPMLFGSAGCIFKGDWGGKDLIKKAGLSGLWHGDAVISPFLPSFILNTGNATFNDIMYLINQIKEKTGLELEIEIWN